MTILAIDPGNTYSGVALIDAGTRKPIVVSKSDNEDLLASLLRIPGGELGGPTLVAIEMIASYGMAVGRDVFDTCVWIGRFKQAAISSPHGADVQLIYRKDVKMHHCLTSTAKDANIIQALVDRFAPGQPNRGKGRSEPRDGFTDSKPISGKPTR